MSLVLDTNAFIALEPASTTGGPRLPHAVSLMRLSQEGQHRLFLSAATKRDIAHDRDAARRAMSESLLLKYQMLGRIEPPQALLDALKETAPPAGRSSNDDNDLEMLSALWVGAVDFLVTDDDRLRRRAGRAGLDERVFTIAEAAAFLERLRPRATAPPPAVEVLKAYQLDVDDPILDSIREDYEGFDDWLRRAAADHRPAWIIRGEGGYSALMIGKNEDGAEMGLPGNVFKVSTFKVAPDAAGRSYGELLLKALFAHAHAADIDTLYLTAFDKHARLVDLVESFGFERHRDTTARGEAVFVKYRRPAVVAGLDHLTAHRRHGPPFVHTGARNFAVPITPNWHDALFPEAQLGLDVWSGRHPYGNALRKAYVSGTGSRLVGAGATVLFYRSQDLQAVTVVGVVEDVRVSASVDRIAQFVGRRSVYTPDDLHAMAAERGELHAMVFRQDRILERPWPLRDLRLMGALNAPPQSITEIRTGGRSWVQEQLAASQ